MSTRIIYSNTGEAAPADITVHFTDGTAMQLTRTAYNRLKQSQIIRKAIARVS